MSDLVTLQLGRIFTDYESGLRVRQSSLLHDSAKLLRREEESSMRARWFRTGASLSSLSEEFEQRGSTQIYRLIVGAFYSIFGEYGTGQRGAVTGEPAPPGYRYGSKPGMAARRFSRLAIDAARPAIHDLHVLGLRDFARNFTTT